MSHCLWLIGNDSRLLFIIYDEWPSLFAVIHRIWVIKERVYQTQPPIVYRTNIFDIGHMHAEIQIVLLTTLNSCFINMSDMWVSHGQRRTVFSNIWVIYWIYFKTLSSFMIDCFLLDISFKDLNVIVQICHFRSWNDYFERKRFRVRLGCF